MGDYNNSVLLGNWAEERLQREYDLKLFLRKRERGELLLQKSRALFSNLLREREMALSGTYIVFGYQTQIVASDMIASIVDGKPKYGLALSGLVDDTQVDYTQCFSEGCPLALSPIKTPCCRNTFTVASYKDSKTQDSKFGQTLTYGEEFMLEIANYDNRNRAPLYVRYEASFVPAPKERMPLYLSASGDTNCRWKAMPLQPRDQLECEGSPVEQGARLVIKNCVADKNLCVMNQSWMQTFFGPECGITLRNYADVHRRVTAENIFRMISDVDEGVKK